MQILAVLFVSSTFLYFYLDDEPVDYGTSLQFDEDRTRGYIDDLLGLGHPTWEGRMSGTAEEQAAAEYINNLFEELGYQSTLHTYEVPMHSVNSEPSLRVCIPGAIGGIGIAPCSPADAGQQVTTFNHRMDYVIQGFSENHLSLLTKTWKLSILEMALMIRCGLRQKARLVTLLEEGLFKQYRHHGEGYRK